MLNYSVIVPTHSRPDFLRRALGSVLSQTVRPAEIIIVDDASDVPVAVESVCSNVHIRVIRQNFSAGGAAARNVGLKAASTDVIAFLDDDDEWLPAKMEKQLAYLENCPNVVLVSCGHLRVEGGAEYPEVFSEQFVRKYAEYDNFFGSFSFITVRRSFRDVLVDPDLPALQDWDFALRVTRGQEFGVVEEPLVRYHAHGLPRITTSRGTHVKGLRRCFFKHQALFSKDARRWLLSRIIFERSRLIVDTKCRRARMLLSLRIAMGCKLSWPVRIRSILCKLANMLMSHNLLLAFRCAALSLLRNPARVVGRFIAHLKPERNAS